MSVYGFSQKHKDWAANPIEKSGLTIGSHGCFITALASIRYKFFPDEKPWTPPEMMKVLEPAIGNRDAMMSPGLIADALAKKVGFYYVGRWTLRNEKAIAEATRNPNQAVIIKVDFNRTNNRKDDTHFVAVDSYNDGGMVIMDPIDGKFKRLPAHYGFTYYAIFEKLPVNKVVQITSDWAVESVKKARIKGVMTDDKRPHDEMTAMDFTAVFLKLGWIEKPKDRVLTRQECAVMLNKRGFLN